MEKVQAQFIGSEEDFLLVTGMICHSCLTNISDFAAHKAKYTPAFIQAVLDRSNAAAQIPNQAQRQSSSTALRAIVSNTNTVSCANYLTLASYIESSFPPEKVEGMKKMAGGAYLDEARKNNWASVTTLNSMMITFINTYGKELASGDMPDDFPDTCANGSKAFDDALDAYENNKLVCDQQAQNRTTAFNSVNNSLKGIMKDGKLIYRNDDAMRKQFTYSAVMEKVTKNGRSGFRIAVTDASTKQPVVTANVQFVQGEWSFNANKKGIILAKLPEGDYSGTVTAKGYNPAPVQFTSTKGVVHREEVTLTAVAEKVLIH